MKKTSSFLKIAFGTFLFILGLLELIASFRTNSLPCMGHESVAAVLKMAAGSLLFLLGGEGVLEEKNR